MMSSRKEKPLPGAISLAGPALSARRAETRRRLIEAARLTISKQGFRGASLDDIAARAGLTKGAVYDNFKSKDELFLAVAAAWGSDRVARFAWPKGRSGTLKSRMRRLAKAFLADDPIARLDAPLRAEFLLYTITHAEMRALVADMASLRLAHVRSHLLEFMDPAELRMSIEQFVLLLEALLPGLTYLRIQAPDLITDEAVIGLFEGLA